MTKLGGALPRGNKNGLPVIAEALVHHPHRYHVALVVLDCKKVTHDNDTGEVEATARIRRIEVIDRADLATAEKLMRRALERRTGETVLPLDLEDDLMTAFRGVDPLTGKVDEPDGP